MSVRTTSVANLDSKLLVTTSDLAKHKARNMKLGDAAFNVDEFVARLVSFMGGRHRLEDDRIDREDSNDWAALGHVAMGICRRPPTIGFMLGPLSVEKKERKVTKRQSERRDNSKVVRPQEVAPYKLISDDIVERGRYSETGECYRYDGQIGR